MDLKTVKIDKPDHRIGYVIINECDFNPETMKLYQEESDKKQRRGRPPNQEAE